MLARFNSRAHGGRDTRRNPRRRPCGFQFTRPRGARPPPMLNHLHRDLFQFTRPRGARPNRRLGSSRRMCFNSRAHGGRDIDLRAVNRHLRVSIHAPTGGATGPCGTRAACRGRFNSRAHGGRDRNLPVRLALRVFQFTRPRGARRKNAASQGVKQRFQFTRPRGARPIPRADRERARVSIHAPTGGATVRPARSTVYLRTFQFTRPRGARRDHAAFAVDALVSIHAPTGGATSLRDFSASSHLFQFTRPRGARRRTARRRCWKSSFNSRAHGGRDAGGRRGNTSSRSFNSRAHGGRDDVPLRVLGLRGVSIHAPTGGATPGRDSRPTRVGFQFTRPRGARRGRRELSPHRRVSIHAPTGGATAVEASQQTGRSVSIHAPTGGATHNPDGSLTNPKHVSIHAPTGGATAYILSYPIVGLQGGFPRTCPFFGLSSLIVNDQVFCARRERPILLPRTS